MFGQSFDERRCFASDIYPKQFFIFLKAAVTTETSFVRILLVLFVGEYVLGGLRRLGKVSWETNWKKKALKARKRCEKRGRSLPKRCTGRSSETPEYDSVSKAKVNFLANLRLGLQSKQNFGADTECCTRVHFDSRASGSSDSNHLDFQ